MESTYSKICGSGRDKKDCTVVMVSVVCDIPYEEAFNLLKAAGRITGRGCGAIIYDKVIREKGFKLERLTNCRGHRPVREGIRPLESKTVRTIERELARYWGGQKVYINVQAHILAWDGTECVDWSVGRQHRVISAFLVYKGDLPASGISVPEPERRSLNRVGQKRTGVIAHREDEEPVHYRSVAAAYRGMGLDLKGHQKVRRYVKYYGEVTCYAYKKQEADEWYSGQVEITIKVA